MSQTIAILHYILATFTILSCAQARLRFRFNILQSDQEANKGGVLLFSKYFRHEPFFLFVVRRLFT